MIKKYLLAVSFCLIAGYFSQAQISAGSIFLGGTINFATSTQTVTLGSTSDKISQFTFNPAVGWATKDNVVVGFDLNYAHSSSSLNAAPGTTSSNIFGAGVFMRRYLPVAKSFYIFGQGRVGGNYITGKTLDANDVKTADANTFEAEFTFYPGVSYQVSKRLHLEAGFNNLFAISYNHTKSNDYSIGAPSQETSGNAFAAGVNFSNLSSLTVGFRVLLSK